MIDTVTYSGFVLSRRKITTLGIRTGVHSEHLCLQQFLGDSHLAEEAAVNEAVLYRVHVQRTGSGIKNYPQYKSLLFIRLKSWKSYTLYLYTGKKKNVFFFQLTVGNLKTN